MSFVFTGTERFQILRQLGAGGMGVVYEALDRETKTRVALKTLRILNGDTLLRFKTEFRSLQGLQHENLVNLRELLENRGHWFFTMELVEGTDFLSYIGRKRYEDLHSEATTLAQGETSMRPSGEAGDRLSDELEMPRATYGVDEGRLRAALGQMVCGLRVLHEAGKVHRDVKPSNCMVTPEGRVVVLDFGLITDLTSSHAWNLETDLVGTVPYMAPEQAAAKPARPAADLYSVGVVLYEALTGLLPFSGPPGLVVQLKQTETPVAPRKLLAEVPPDLDALCMDLLKIAPEARPTTDDVLTRLGFLELRSRRISTSSGREAAAEGAPAFVGRATELSLLHAAYADSRERAVAVLLSSESGMGKSSLLARFTAQLGGAGGAGAGGGSSTGAACPLEVAGLPPDFSESRSRSVSRSLRVNSWMRGTSSALACWLAARRRNPFFSNRPSARRGGSLPSCASSGSETSACPVASSPLVPVGSGFSVFWPCGSTVGWSGDSVQPPASAVVVGWSASATYALQRRCRDEIDERNEKKRVRFAVRLVRLVRFQAKERRTKSATKSVTKCHEVSRSATTLFVENSTLFVENSTNY